MEISIICVSNESGDRFERTLNNIVEKAVEFNNLHISTEVVLKFSTGVNWHMELPSFVNVIFREDKGIYDAMNQALDLAKGNWCIFINSGDRFLLEPVDFMKLIKRDVSYVGKFTSNGDLRVNSKHFRWNGKSLCHQSVLIFNKDVVFSTEYKHISDYIFFLGLKNLSFTDLLVSDYGAEKKSNEYKRRNKWEKCRYNALNFRPISFVFSLIRFLRHEIGL